MHEWVGEEFFDNADEYFSSLLVAIAQAKVSIEFETYIFEKSKIGDQLLAALKAAFSRGVLVRVLIDGVGSVEFLNHYPIESLDELPIRMYHPVPWVRLYSELTHNTNDSYFPSNFFHLLGSLNSRNHRKVCVIDSRLAFLGSVNVTDKHLAKFNGEKAWCDYGVKVEGTCVEALQYAFEKAWKTTLSIGFTFPSLKKLKRLKRFNKFFMLNHTRKLRQRSRNILIQRIKNAKNRIYLITPYFVPTVRLQNTLVRAAMRGVDVKILLPQQNDVRFMRWVMKLFYDVLLKQGVKVYEYVPTVLHAKAALIDSWCLVGSTNLNSRSIFHDLEANYILQTDKLKLQLESTFYRELRLSEQVHFKREHPWYEKIMGRILLIFRYWI